MKYLIFFFSTFLLIGSGFFLHSSQVSAWSVKQLLGLETQDSIPGDSSTNQESQELAEVVSEDDVLSLDFGHIQSLIAYLDKSQSDDLLTDEVAFQQFVRNEANSRSVLASALDNDVDNEDKTVFLVRRGVQNILTEAYISKLIELKIPAEFPTDQQVIDYYEQNKETFVIEQRLHVWQIFLTVSPDDDTKSAKQVMQQAKGLLVDIRAKKTDFENAATIHSDHELSRSNGGYMGLLQISELLPEVKEPLLKLGEGELSEPIQTESGIHIVKRGSVLDKVDIPVASVMAQIRQSLLTQTRNKLRQAIYEQASTTYPVSIKDSRIEEWRLRLKTNIAN